MCPGPLNAITDVAGVQVGMTTIIRDAAVRTGVTAILPRGKSATPVFGAWFPLNGNGEMTGTPWRVWARAAKVKRLRSIAAAKRELESRGAPMVT